jgi:hypothetical protein
VSWGNKAGAKLCVGIGKPVGTTPEIQDHVIYVILLQSGQ